ncbi:S-methyl-5-thioribose-1-phosphate isomerase [Pichia californica]|uniref:S-methyl-5-thioribose-1-phosphate isomerase n=1 Tax=Pichia californica TaxID=460514 RepID=A0A9P6WP49_9ASCO|nr:S-methyl-5-thioribose-1-phosphate isomerase [[Candida] californica]KAG0690687.1 S-methyl-5-thioribose-1-phosphate isomerase [[Candida] californica]
MSLQAIKFHSSPEVSLSILNQLQVPYQSKYLDVDSIAPIPEFTQFSGYDAIKGMYTRGAPAIMLVGCFSIVVELNRVINGVDSKKFGYDITSITQFKIRLLQRIDELISSRPTAVNLTNGCNEIKKIINSFQNEDLKQLYKKILDFSENLYKEDYQSNIDIGNHGLKYIIDILSKENYNGPFSVMTICNTGSLATSGHGTALGIIRHLNQFLSKDKSKYNFYFDHAYPCETRPYNQGSRLTAYELQYENIPFTLITDNMASFLIDNLNRKKNHTNQNILSTLSSNSPIRFIIVGSDRIVQNGDLANKIGTFQLSLIAKQYNEIKFIGAAPTTTIDYSTKSGEDIKIEERPKDELTMVLGAKMNGNVFATDSTTGDVVLERVRMAPLNIQVWNPSFDVTPHANIDCIVTEKDYLVKDDAGNFHL